MYSRDSEFRVGRQLWSNSSYLLGCTFAILRSHGLRRSRARRVGGICSVDCRSLFMFSFAFTENNPLRSLNCLECGVINIILTFMTKHIPVLSINTYASDLSSIRERYLIDGFDYPGNVSQYVPFWNSRHKDK